METKAGIISADIKSADSEKGTFEAILSAPTLDRDDEVIDKGAFHPLPDHIPIDIDHGMSTASIVGSGKPFYEGDVLMFRGTFASTPLGQEVRTLVTEGHVRKMSVAFRQAVREVDETDGKMHIRSAELLNAAIVPIPSNREASILVAKALKSGARHSASDLEHIQAAHDALSHLGASCKASEAPKSLDLGTAGGVHMTWTLPHTEVDADGNPVDQKTAVEDPEKAPAPAAAPPAPSTAKALALAAEATLLLTE